ncbi:MAG: hypothetical protein JWN98_1142 [Abditibacteriota bacterium]|nr:hypothetical protein [Abditibacteriota bacterium]
MMNTVLLSHRRPLLWFVSATIATIATSMTAPAQAQFGSISEQEEIRAGQQASQQAIKEFGRPLPANHPMSQRVRSIGARFARLSARSSIPYTYTVLQNDKVLNAFAAPGGPIFVTTKLLQTTANDAELAYVLGHETAHIDRKHIVKAVAKQQKVGLAAGILGAILGRGKKGNVIGTAINLTANVWASGYSRDNETESDTVGVRWMSQLGYDPRYAVSMLGKLGSGGGGGIAKYLSTHPAPKDRQNRVTQQIQKENLLDVARRSGGPATRLSSDPTSWSSPSTNASYEPDYPVNAPGYPANSPADYPTYDDSAADVGRGYANEIDFGAPLRIVERGEGSVILAPVAGVARWAGATVRNNGRTTFVQRNGHNLELRQFSTVAYHNNRDVRLSVAPEIFEGRLYAPLGDVVEGLGGQARFDNQLNAAVISIDGRESIIRL